MDEHVRKLISELPLAPTGIITQKEYGEYFLPTYQRVREELRKHADLDAVSMFSFLTNRLLKRLHPRSQLWTL